MRKLKSSVAVLIVAFGLLGIGFGISQASVPDASGVIHTCYKTSIAKKTFYVIDSSTASCATGETTLNFNQMGPAGSNLGSDVSPGGSTGHYVDMPYGAIPTGGTPVTLMTVPGFGRVDITLCDAAGNSNQVFTNTSGVTLVNFFQRTTIPPGGTFESSGGVQVLLAKGNGPTSQVTQIGTNYWDRTDVSLCAFHGINL